MARTKELNKRLCEVVQDILFVGEICVFNNLELPGWKTSLLHSNTQYHVFDKHIVQTEVYMVYATTVHVYHMWFIFTR